MICKISCKIFVLTVEYRFPSWYSKTISIWPFFTFSFMFSDNVVHCILNPCRKMKQGLQIFVHYAFPFNSLITTCPFFALHILLSQGHCLSELLKRLWWWFCSFGFVFRLNHRDLWRIFCIFPYELHWVTLLFQRKEKASDC